jgi:LmbE family N-acetylglucosaminyl deacetylase
MRRLLLVVAVGLAVAVISRLPAGAQVRPIYDRGAAGLTQTLERLRTTASALHTGAHPDDEDSAFIARVARGDHARVAYLSLNRGEGGQNLIGTELFDALGVIRTEELLQARALDGGEQFFTRTFDYGFSKSRQEAAALWNERETLGDMVRVIRMFRPLVVYSRFSGTEADGHGHHQMAGYLTPQAFRAAGDATQFPEQIADGLRPWQPRKLYRGQGRGGGAPTLEIQTGTFDPVIGRSLAAIALEGRSQHKSQSMGTIEALGPQATGLILIESLADDPAGDTALFAGLDVSVPGLATLAGLPAGALAAELAAMDTAARAALDAYDPREPAAILPARAAGLRATRDARAALDTLDAPEAARAEADFLRGHQEADFSLAVVQAAGVTVDPLAEAETVVQGGTLGVTVRAFVEGAADVTVVGQRLVAPDGWAVTEASADQAAGRGGGPVGRREVATTEQRYAVGVPADAPLTQPYYLDDPRDGAVYEWDDDDPRALPFAPPLLRGVVTIEVAGERVDVTRPVEYRFADDIRGELRRAVNVVPLLSVGLDSPFLIVPTGDTPRAQSLVVRASSFSPAPVSGSLRLRLPEGWISEPVEVAFTLAAAGAQAAAAFTVTAPAGRTEGSFDIGAEARVGDQVLSQDVQTVAYPHIQTHRLYWPAVTTAQVLPLEVAPVRVGYVMGSGDQVPDAIRRLGIDLTLIDDETLATGDLDAFNTIVVGVRASEARPAFVASNARLLDYVRRGGTLVVQYQQTYAAERLAPYPVEQDGNLRVTDEGAAVRILAPDHPLFTFPNRITDADFAGWVQERNLYTLTGFDDRYTPLLEAADPGEAPSRGGHVYADYGEGRFVYTAYAWFRQLPAGVPGAYRQFANLLSLGRAPR